MPLDVQPLSPTRRVLLVIVMALLLASSLALAQVLVRRENAVDRAAQTAESEPIVVRFLPPPGVGAIPVNTSADVDATKLSAQITLPQGPRAVWAFDVPAGAADLPQAFVDMVLYRILPSPGQVFVGIAGQIAGIPAFEVQKVVDQGDEPGFAMIRVVHIPGRMVAFCLSGELPLTDADREFFNAYCAQRIVIQAGLPETKG